MTISNQNNRVTQVGNGVTTTIAIPFPVHTPGTDLVVYSVVLATGVATAKVITTDWTWSGTPDARGNYPNGGTITMVAGAWASTIEMVVFRDPDLIQDLDLVEDDSLPVEELEAALDYQHMLIQRVRELANRSLKQPDSDPDQIGEIPTVVDRASKFLFFNAAGEPTAAAGTTEVGVSAFAETLLDDAHANEFVETLEASLSALTAPAVGDQVVVMDASDGASGYKMTLANLLKVIDALTEDTSPDHAADFLVTYDASATAAKKVKFGALLPPGAIEMYAGAAAPTGWLLCDGSAVSRSTYAALFAVTSTTYGSGDGSTTFNVPDMRGRVPVGVGTGTGGGASGTGAPSGGSALTAVARATWKGAETHTLSTAEMPAHTHAPAAGSIISDDPAVIASSGGGDMGADTLENTGGGGAHNNMQPVMGVNFIIKT